jgi:hypothetical protein
MEAADRVSEFLGQMLAWEKERLGVLKSDSYKSGDVNFRGDQDNKSRKKLNSILESYLTPQAINTLGAAKAETMGVGRPPIYDQSVVEARAAGECFLILCESNNGGLLGYFIRYTLKKVDNEWKIDLVHSSRNRVDWRKNNSI